MSWTPLIVILSPFLGCVTMLLLYKILTFPHYLRKKREEKQAKRRAHWKRHLAFMYKLGLVDKDMVWKYGAMDW